MVTCIPGLCPLSPSLKHTMIIFAFIVTPFSSDSSCIPLLRTTVITPAPLLLLLPIIQDISPPLYSLLNHLCKVFFSYRLTFTGSIRTWTHLEAVVQSPILVCFQGLPWLRRTTLLQATPFLGTCIWWLSETGINCGK